MVGLESVPQTELLHIPVRIEEFYTEGEGGQRDPPVSFPHY